MSTRRGFLASLMAGAVLDPERLLWVPGAKLVSIPAAPKVVTSEVGISIRMERRWNRRLGCWQTHMDAYGDGFTFHPPHLGRELDRAALAAARGQLQREKYILEDRLGAVKGDYAELRTQMEVVNATDTRLKGIVANLEAERDRLRLAANTQGDLVRQLEAKCAERLEVCRVTAESRDV